MEYPDECPSSFSEVEKASRRLDCGKDKFGNNQYLCIPSAEKDSLIEFCHNGIMGLQEKGNCLKSSNGGLILENCTHFVFGCPEEYFKSSDIFKYPACQAINRNLRCYMLDPLCQPAVGDDACSNDGMVHWTSNIPIYVVMFCLTVAVGILGFAVRRKYRESFKGNRKDSAEDIIHLIRNNVNRENTADYGSQLSIIDDGRIFLNDSFNTSKLISKNGRISRRTASIIFNKVKRDGSISSKAFSNISDPTPRSAYGSISSKAVSNISDPISRSAYRSISSKAVFNMSDPIWTATNLYRRDRYQFESQNPCQQTTHSCSRVPKN